MSQETRTPAYYDHLRSIGTREDEIERIRSNIERSLGDHTLTAWFIHEARNVFGIVGSSDLEVRALLVPTPEDYADAKARLLKVKIALEHYVSDGELSSAQIATFLEAVETSGEWDAEVADGLYQRYVELIKGID